MSREYNFYVYIMASSSGTTYVGVTNDIIRRVNEHKNRKTDGFTKKYFCNKLVYFEHHEEAECAIRREKIIKKWSRLKKENLISSLNPLWKDLYDVLLS